MAKRGRPKGSRNKKATYRGEVIDDRKLLKNSGEVYLQCSKCKRDITVFANDVRIYTEDIKKNYICIFCR